MYIWKIKCNEGCRKRWVRNKAVCLQNKAVGPHKSSVSAVDSGGSAIKQCVCKIKRWVRIKQCVCWR